MGGRELKKSPMRKKILVVEDDTQLLELLRLHLKAAGLAVATATNGIEALKKARSLSPDLVLLDLVLPELDGFAVCETLRRAPATASIPIVILTGLTSYFARCAGLEAGTCEFMTKPASPTHLVARIKELLGEPRGSGSTQTRENPSLQGAPAKMPSRSTLGGAGLAV